jgi:hypothetical protein
MIELETLFPIMDRYLPFGQQCKPPVVQACRSSSVLVDSRQNVMIFLDPNSK